MNNLNHLNNIPDPNKKKNDKDVVDPEKFKKTLKIDASEEIDQRRKRNRTRQQEEEGDEDDANIQEAIPIPRGVFKQYMAETGRTQFAFEQGSSTTPTLSSDEDKIVKFPSNTYSPKTDGKIKSNLNITTNPSDSTDPKSLEEQDHTEGTTSAQLEENINEQSSKTQPPPVQQQPSQPPIDDTFIPNMNDTTDNIIEDEQPTSQSDTNNEQNISNDNGSTEKKTHTTQSDNQKKPTKSEKKDKKKDSAKEKKNTKEKFIDLIKDKKIPAKDLEKDKIHLKKNDTTKEKDIPKDKSSNLQTTGLSLSGQSDQQKDQKNDNQDQQDGISPIDAGKQLISNTQNIQLSSFSNMPSDVFQLFQKMVGIMTIEQNNGKNTTAITLSMPNSVFDKCELVLDHYDTAPHAYNVQLLGNPEAIAKFSKNMKNLNNALGEKQLTFSINLLPPKLSKGYVDKIERKENPQEESEEENDGEQNE